MLALRLPKACIQSRFGASKYPEREFIAHHRRDAHFGASYSRTSQEKQMNPASVAPSTRLHQLQGRLNAARARGDELFQIVRPEAIYDRPLPERHRIIFYLGHLEAFDWNP